MTRFQSQAGARELEVVAVSNTVEVRVYRRASSSTPERTVVLSMSDAQHFQAETGLAVDSVDIFERYKTRPSILHHGWYEIIDSLALDPANEIMLEVQPRWPGDRGLIQAQIIADAWNVENNGSTPSP